ncbi:glycoside hydrolase family 2 TIM barrel-domain containing protein [Filimonas effusa]|uniref:DUF4982 domain-containing protein n=1 Tax=Filimonas effusa TaxID=2508721 RepID=A0A4Q1D5L0_9BACT|nr:glycoside hydrolase family 2 TIM barrel-domain containing protein [Filimonas effusa]RXK83800.1 DUF4982 domain-containing protein [Filimonas effusa]
MRKRLLCCFFLVSAQAALTSVAHAQHKARVLLTTGWQFFLDSTGKLTQMPDNTATWLNVQLPHDWSIEGSFSDKHPATPGGGALPGGTGWYRKEFITPANAVGKELYIEFDGIYQNSEVWINGHSLGIRPNGYISFRYAISRFLKPAPQKNLLVVKADNAKQPNSRWYSGSGVYRNVWLTTTGKIAVDQWGTFVTTPQVSRTQASVHITTTLRNTSGKPQHVTLITQVLNPDGKELTQLKDTLYVTTDSLIVSHSLLVKHPLLWSDETPYMYKLLTKLQYNRSEEVYITPFGIRSFYFDAAKGFFLNNRPLKIKGVCNHHDLGCLGAAINTRAMERQLELLKAMGCNGIRTSHNPPAPELLDLCDKMGFIVMDEAFDMWEKQKNPFDYHLDFKEWHRKDLQDLVKRDRNHPSVFIWSIGNEIGEQWGTGADTSGRTIARTLAGIVRSLDTTREIVTANNEIQPFNNLILSNASDLIGYNYNHWKWDSFFHAWPGKKMIVTESVSALATRGHYDKIPSDSIRRWPEAWDKPFTKGNPGFTVSAYDNVSAPWGSTHEETLKLFLRMQHVSGMYVWTGFDYLGEPTPYTWPARSSYFGILDLAGFPKDVYYLYQSMWTNKPVLHLLPHWNWNNNDTIDVVAYYNNADEVELFLNNTSLGIRKKDTSLHVKWRVPFAPGTLKAVARKDGRTVLQQERRTAGAPHALRLIADRTSIGANSRDLSFITVQVIDDKGNIVPDADIHVNFKVAGEGKLIAVDNGSPVSHSSFKAPYCNTLNGLCLAVIQSNDRAGVVTLTAEAADLSSGFVKITAR